MEQNTANIQFTSERNAQQPVRFPENPGQTAAQNTEVMKNTGMPCNTGAPQSSAMPQNTESPERIAKRAERSKIFRSIGIPAVLYAVVTALLLYYSFSGVAMTLESVITVLFALWSVKRAGRSVCRGGLVMLAAILLLGLSSLLTGNAVLQVFSGIGVFFLLLQFMVFTFREPAGESFGENIRELVTAPLRGIKGIRFPFVDSTAYLKTGKPGRKRILLSILIGLAIALPLVIVVLALLSSADAVFRGMLENLFGEISFWTPFGIATSAVLWFMAVYSILRMLREPKKVRKEKGSRVNAVIGITVCAPLTLIYLVFSGIQILFLFFWNLELPWGYTYAEYAHEGFYQLLAVCVINLLLVLIIKEIFQKNKGLSIFLTVIGAGTYIMAASSALRMIIYVRVYGLTFLRVVVLWALLVIAVLFAGVLVRVWNDRFFLFRYMLVTVTAAWLVLAFAKPDRLIARYNLYNPEVETDYWYLSELSADAAPVFYEYARDNGYFEGTNRHAEEWSWYYDYNQRIAEKQDWQKTTLPWLKARKYIQTEQTESL